MSTRGILLRHPVNGSPEQTWEGFSWPAFFLGVIWLLMKGLYRHFLINLVLLLVSAGFAAPLIWVVYGFIGNEAHKSSLLRKGYLTTEAWEQKNAPPSPSTAQATPAAPVDSISKLRDLAELKSKGILTEEEFLVQKAKILR